ncbi:MAG: NAD-dependent epimerase/dehydratase family protein [Planctomycetota bacterium]|jgi:nucleoside-diphosphate-sugar epimerase
MPHVLVSGAAGFIGRAVCKKIVDKGWPVTGSVRAAPEQGGLDNQVRVINLGPIKPNTAWDSALDGIDTVIHLAACLRAEAEASVDPLSAYRAVNVAGTESLARTAAAKNIRRFIHLSTVKVHGEGRDTGYNETNPPKPADPYAISKYEAECKLLEIADETGLDVVILRCPLVYGPGVKDNFMQLLKMVNRGIPLPFSRVKNRRSLIFLDNLIDAIVTCILHPTAAGQTYLVSDDEDVSTPELIRRMAGVLGQVVRLFSFPPVLMRLTANLVGQSHKLTPLLDSLFVDTLKIRSQLDWSPPYSQQEGLLQTGQWLLKEHCRKNK